MTLENRFEKVYINFYQNVRKYFLLILVTIIQIQSLLSACTVGRSCLISFLLFPRTDHFVDDNHCHC